MSNCHFASTQLAKVLSRIENACNSCGRDVNGVTLIGASKKQTSTRMRDFAGQGLKNVGENYLQEAIEKRSQLQDLDLIWHFIGQIQSNKTKPIAEHFRWVHGVDRLKIATRLGVQNPRAEPLNILLQINADNEPSKGGILPTAAPELCGQVADVPGIRLRGFMLIPKARDSFDAQRSVFAQARELLVVSNQRYGLTMDHLSMGMSGDMEAAIREGSTMVRVGTDLFGPRDY